MQCIQRRYSYLELFLVINVLPYCSVPQALGKMLGISTNVKTLSDLHEWGVLCRPMNNYLSLEGFGRNSINTEASKAVRLSTEIYH